MPSSTFVRFDKDAVSVENLWCVVTVNRFHFKGSDRNEQFQVGFTENRTGRAKVTAMMTLGRNTGGRVFLSGTAFGAGGTQIDERIILPTPGLWEPLQLILKLNRPNRAYEVFYQFGDQPLTSIGVGQVAVDRHTNFVRLRVARDFAAKGEFIDIDSIQITTIPPADT